MIDSGAKKSFKAEARKILYRDWLTHIFIYLAVIVCFSGLVNLGEQLAHLSYSFGVDEFGAGLFLVFYDFAALFFAVPMCYGVLYFEMLCCDGKKPEPLCIFDAFSSVQKLLFSYELFFSLLFRVILCFVPAMAMYVYMEYFYVQGMYVPIIDIAGVDEIFFMLSTAFVVLVLFGFTLSVKYFVGVYVAMMRNGISKREAFYIGSACCHNNNISICVFFLTFVPLFVVSLFTVGILFVVYTLPYFILSFINLAKYLYEKEMIEGNIKDIIYNHGNAE